MKKRNLSIIVLSSIFVSASLISINTNKKTEAIDKSYHTTNYLYKDDKVMFANLSCDAYELTGGEVMQRNGGTTSYSTFEGSAPTANELNLFTVEQGYTSGTFAFKIGNSYLRSDGKAPKFVLPKVIEAYKDGTDYTFDYPLNIGGIDTFLTWVITDNGGSYEAYAYSDYEIGGTLIAQVINDDVTMQDGTITYDLHYFKAPNWDEVIVSSLTMTYTFNGGVLLVDDPTAVKDVVDQESSWKYSYDKILGTSSIQSCLNNKYLTFQDGKFKMVDVNSPIDIYIDSSINVDGKHKPNSISLNTDNVMESIYVGEKINWPSLEVSAYYSNGVSSSIPLGGYDISFDKDNSQVGTVTATVSVYGVSKTFTYEVIAKPAPEVKLKDLSFSNYKTTYYVGEEFDYNVDITVSYVGKENHLLTKEEKEERVTIQAPNMSRKGYQRAAQVAYWEIIDGKKQEFKIGAGKNYYVDILEPTFVLSSISATLVDGYTYYDDASFNYNGVVIEATYTSEQTSDKKEVVTSLCSYEVEGISKGDLLPLGNNKVTASYTYEEVTKTVDFVINVTHKPVHTGYIIEAPDAYVGTTYDYSTAVVKETFDVGEAQVITGWNVNATDLYNIANSKLPQSKVINFELKGKNIGNKEINIVFAPVSSFSLKYESSKVDAKVGDTQQLFIKKVNSEPTLENIDWLLPLSERSQAYLNRFTFVSTDTDVATVSEQGLVTYVGEGAANIVVTPKEGSAPSQNYSIKIGEIKPKSITLSEASITLKERANATLVANVLPLEAVDKSVTWSSSDEKVASVDQTGKITAIKEGVATISAKTVNDLEASCTVTVTPIVHVASIEVSGASSSLEVGKNMQLSAKVLPEDAEDKSVTWCSSEPSIASVSTQGVVTALRKGTVTITATSKLDEDIKGAYQINITQPVTSITINGASHQMDVDTTMTLTATIKPDNADNKEVNWSSSDTSIATISNGVVTALKVGLVTITATSVNNPTVKATYDIEVKEAVIHVTSISLSETTLNMNINTAFKLTATVNPSDATNKNVRWISSDTSIATIDQQGNINAIKVGSCEIKCVSLENENVYATCKVNVTQIVPPAPKKGCGGDIAATSIILATLSLVGVVLIISLKKKHN